MSRLILIVGLFSCLAFSTAVSMHNKAAVGLQRTFMDFMIKSRDISQKNPQRSLECFDYYIPILNGLTDEYEKSYALCVSNSEADFSKIDEATQPTRDQIESSAENACYSLNHCVGYSKSTEYFECFAKSGSDNSKVMYTISADASEALADVRESYRLIEVDMYKCTNASDRAYVENTATTIEELQNCLAGVSGVPTTTEATTLTTVDDTTATPEETTPTTVEAEDTTTEESRVQPVGRMTIEDTKWRHMLKKLGKYVH